MDDEWPFRPVTVLGSRFDPAMRRPFVWPAGCVILVKAYTDRPIVFYVDSGDCSDSASGASAAAAKLRGGVAAAYARAVGEPSEPSGPSVGSIESWLSLVEQATRAPLASVVAAGALVLTAVPSYFIRLQRTAAMRTDSAVTVSLWTYCYRSCSMVSSVFAAGSLSEDMLAAAQQILVERNLITGDQRILDHFCFPDADVNHHRLMPTDLLPAITGLAGLARSRLISMPPRDVCTVCLELIRPSDTPCTAHDPRLPMVIPDIKTCSNCSGLPGAEIRMWSPLLLVPDTRSNKLSPIWIQVPSKAVAPASVPIVFRTPWQRNAVFLARLRLVLARARLMHRTDMLSSLPSVLTERILSLASALFDMGILAAVS
jgi:hypothetical protein